VGRSGVLHRPQRAVLVGRSGVLHRPQRAVLVGRSGVLHRPQRGTARSRRRLLNNAATVSVDGNGARRERVDSSGKCVAAESPHAAGRGVVCAPSRVRRCLSSVPSVHSSRIFTPKDPECTWAARDICAGTQLAQTPTNRAHPQRTRRATSNPSSPCEDGCVCCVRAA
jgi:hypothetical protein